MMSSEGSKDLDVEGRASINGTFNNDDGLDETPRYYPEKANRMLENYNKNNPLVTMREPLHKRYLYFQIIANPAFIIRELLLHSKWVRDNFFEYPYTNKKYRESFQKVLSIAVHHQNELGFVFLPRIMKRENPPFSKSTLRDLLNKAPQNGAVNVKLKVKDSL